MEILHSIVKEYIESGDPVASRTISRGSRQVLSSASVRNIMADLSEEGFLFQPHTSAGRVPTEKAFRSYVQSLAASRVISGELQRLRNQLRQAASVEARIASTSHILTEMTRNVGIAAAIPASSQSLHQIELMALVDKRVLMIVVTGDRMIRNQVVELPDQLSQDELNEIRNYVNRNFSGMVLAEVRERLRERLAHESAAYDAILKRLSVLYSHGLLDLGPDPEVHLEGAAYLVGVDLDLTKEKMRELFQALEQKKRLLMLLDRFLDQPDGELAVQVGLADVHPAMGQLSLIGISVAMPEGLETKIAVLGPMRMNYQKAISAVLHIGQALQAGPQ
ncbi:MAG: heat-inducible transcription repressor HrcA [Acidobacteria bacterium]|nr:heat-inducible transcription repressor HrcA [Acidobacteriota bacterium]